jgi:hypothetical protein
VAEGPQPGAGELAAIEDRGVVAGVADHRVARLEDGADAAQVRLVAGGEHDRVLGSHPLGQLPLEIEVNRRGAVEQARAGHPSPEGLERVTRRLLDAIVVGQPEVVVRAEHDPLAALHLDHWAGLRGEDAEIGEQIALLGRLELLETVVSAGLLEDVDGRPGRVRHQGECRLPAWLRPPSRCGR